MVLVVCIIKDCLIFTDSCPEITVQNIENGDRISNPDLLEEYLNSCSSKNNGYKCYENVDDWTMSSLENIQAGLPSVRLRKKKPSNLKMDQRRTIKQHTKVYCRISKPPEQPPPLHERRQRLRRRKTVGDNFGEFVASLR